eukprot:TRINITY_DN1969_c0_g1_i1.p1 TRINITY_DN1969_c0_g1~~TRINITY_DN1969_c0_g1_i1.p1  ORF type:complete len:421 (-),score=45.17 TRINITY_DN1969_c0_g1_i1:684-1946(-)
MNGPRMLLLILCACIFLMVTPCFAKISNGNVIVSNSFKFIDKFCFEKEGRIEMKITWEDQANQSILLFDETDNKNWDSLKELNSCDEKSVIELFNEKDYLISIEPLISNYTFIVGTNTPKWIFVAACANRNKINISHYTIRFLNDGGYWNVQVSFDQKGILESDVAFIIAFQLALFVMAHLYSALKKLGLQTGLIRGLMVCSSFKIAFLGCDVIYRYLFSRNGVGLSFLQYIGTFFDMAHFVILFTILIFLGRGWLSTPSMPLNRMTIVLLGCLVTSNLSIFVWLIIFSGNPVFLYLFDSTPGYILIAIRVSCFIWFILQIAHTLLFENNNLKRRFYNAILITCGAWIILLPLVALLTHFMASYSREKIVTSFNQVIDFLIYAGFIILFTPFKGNKYLNLLETDLILSSPLSQILPESIN